MKKIQASQLFTSIIIYLTLREFLPSIKEDLFHLGNIDFNLHLTALFVAIFGIILIIIAILIIVRNYRNQPKRSLVDIAIPSLLPKEYWEENDNKFNQKLRLHNELNLLGIILMIIGLTISYYISFSQ